MGKYDELLDSEDFIEKATKLSDAEFTEMLGQVDEEMNEYFASARRKIASGGDIERVKAEVSWLKTELSQRKVAHA